MTDLEATIATRKWFVENARKCITEAQSGKTHVNDLASYVAWREQAVEDYLSGKNDNTFTFWQRRHFIQTGECVPFLAKQQTVSQEAA